MAMPNEPKTMDESLSLTSDDAKADDAGTGAPTNILSSLWTTFA